MTIDDPDAPLVEPPTVESSAVAEAKATLAAVRDRLVDALRVVDEAVASIKRVEGGET